MGAQAWPRRDVGDFHFNPADGTWPRNCQTYQPEAVLVGLLLYMVVVISPIPACLGLEGHA